MQELQTNDQIYDALKAQALNGQSGELTFKHIGHPVHVGAQEDSPIGPMRLVFIGIPTENVLLKYCPRELLLHDNQIIRRTVFGGGFPFVLEPYRFQDWTGSQSNYSCHFLVVAFRETQGLRGIADGIASARARFNALTRDEVEKVIYDLLFTFMFNVRGSVEFRRDAHLAIAAIEMMGVWRERAQRFEAKAKKRKKKKGED